MLRQARASFTSDSQAVSSSSLGARGASKNEKMNLYMYIYVCLCVCVCVCVCACVCVLVYACAYQCHIQSMYESSEEPTYFIVSLFHNSFYTSQWPAMPITPTTLSLPPYFAYHVILHRPRTSNIHSHVTLGRRQWKGKTGSHGSTGKDSLGDGGKSSSFKVM